MKNNKKIMGLFCILMLFFFIRMSESVRAATLSYTSNTNIVLTTPSTVVTIVAGSVADNLTVNSGNISVMMSSTTNGVFTVNSSSFSFSVATSSVGGVIQNQCISGTASTTISQLTASTTYTITPIPTLCEQPSLPVIISTSVSNGPPVGLTNLIGSLPAFQSSPSQVATSTPFSSPAYLFTKNLSSSSSGEDVKHLQLFLVSQNKGPSARKLSAHGLTTFFGTLTFDALVEFQKSMNITPPSGYFGPTTRLFINNLSQIATSSVQPNSISSRSSKHTFMVNLKLGSTGSEVTFLQTYLFENGLLTKSNITGYYGLLTKKAISLFQEKYNIVKSSDAGYGQLGPKTRTILNSLQ